MGVPAPPEESIHRTPRAQLVDRASWLVDAARGKTVIDLGFVDVGRDDAKRAHGSWLHEALAGVAGTIVGIDSDESGVQRARDGGLRAHSADVESRESLAGLELAPAELVVAGELIEHLANPGAFLDAVRVLVAPGGRLVITTPNAVALTNALAGFLGLELVNADHVGWQSWRTLETLLHRYDWQVVEVAYYGFPRLSGRGRRVRLFNAYQSVARPVFRARPSLADGLIVAARP